jgi:hypothetical protein
VVSFAVQPALEDHGGGEAVDLCLRYTPPQSGRTLLA